MSFANKNILITGGLGFIGSALAKKLVKDGANVTLVDSLVSEYGGNLHNIESIRHKVVVNISDVRDPVSMAYLLRGQDFLFNLAGQTSHLDSMLNPLTDLENNSAAQLSILETCRKVNPEVKVVFASTRQIYGKPDYLPVDEGHPLRPVDVNGINKLSGEMYHKLYQQVYGLRICVLRLTNTYGPGMRVKDARQTFLGVWIRKMLEGSPIQIYGDGLQKRDFNYVDDCVEAFMLCALNESSNGKIYNLGGSEVISLVELAELMKLLVSGSRSELIPFPADRKAIDIGDYYGDYSFISSEIGWKPEISLKKGLLETIDYYKLNRDFYWSSSAS
jgi:UDP-glucose 4-epimerase